MRGIRGGLHSGAVSTPSEPQLDPLGPSSTGTGTLLERELDTTPETSHGDGDHERFAHYVRKEKIVESAVLGDPVIALCGKVWVPSRDPKKFPVCPTCKEIYDSLSGGGGADGGS
jgi:hypothetical protein